MNVVKKIHFDVSLSTRLNVELPDSVRDEIISGRALVVFDFDGVLSSDIEEGVYQASEEPGERERLNGIAKMLNIVAELYDTNYLRHLVYQAVLEILNVEVAPGPFLELAQKLTSEKFPYYILSARSSPAAISRVQTFCRKHSLTPQETFFVGRVGKGRQLHLVGSGAPKKTVVYFEDSKRHVKNSVALAHDPLKTVHVVWGRREHGPDAREAFEQVVAAYIQQVGSHRGQPKFSGTSKSAPRRTRRR